MTKQSYKRVLEMARVTGIPINTVITGVQRYSVVINGVGYRNVNAATNAITTQYLKNKKRK